jgi:hypothetical protein
MHTSLNLTKCHEWIEAMEREIGTGFEHWNLRVYELYLTLKVAM